MCLLLYICIYLVPDAFDRYVYWYIIAASKKFNAAGRINVWLPVVAHCVLNTEYYYAHCIYVYLHKQNPFKMHFE